MSRAIKLKNNDYIDVSSIVYNKQVLKTILDTNNKAENGYCKLQNGLILQWGIDYSAGITVREYSKIINFPVSFPNACFNVQLTINDPGFGLQGFTTGIGLSSKTKSNFTFNLKSTSEKYPSINIYTYWFAIGY